MTDDQPLDPTDDGAQDLWISDLLAEHDADLTQAAAWELDSADIWDEGYTAAPMPDHVASRTDSTLEALMAERFGITRSSDTDATVIPLVAGATYDEDESGTSAGAAAASAAVAADNVVPLSKARAKRSWRPGLAAASVAIIALGAVGIVRFSSGGDSPVASGGGSTADVSGRSAAATTSSPADSNAPSPSNSVTPVQQSNAGEPTELPSFATELAAHVVKSGTKYQRSSIMSQAHRAVVMALGAHAGAKPTESTYLAQLVSCVDAIKKETNTAASTAVAVIDEATFENAPARVVVLTDLDLANLASTGEGPIVNVGVAVVGNDCGNGTADLKASWSNATLD